MRPPERPEDSAAAGDDATPCGAEYGGLGGLGGGEGASNEPTPMLVPPPPLLPAGHPQHELAFARPGPELYAQKAASLCKKLWVAEEAPTA